MKGTRAIVISVLAVAVTLPAAASDASREPSHAPNRVNETQYPAAVGPLAAPFFTEDFDGGSFPPTGWTVVDNEANGSATTWDLNTTFSDYNGNYTGGAGNCAMVCSDCDNGDFDVELRSPAIDCTDHNNVVLKFSANYQNFANYDYFEVDVSADNGATWTNVLTWNEDHGGFGDLPGEPVTLNISSLVDGQSQVMVRFHYYDPNTNDWDWYVQVDDVAVGESRVGIPALSSAGIATLLALFAGGAILVIRRRI